MIVVPNTLLARDIWVCRRGKLPISARTNRAADCSDPSTWTDYHSAERAAWRHTHTGLAFALGNGVVGIDLDGCYSNGWSLTPRAQAIVDRMNTYVEFSPSITGVHILALGELPASRRTEGVEMYGGQRFFSFTGTKLADTPFDLQPRQTELDALYRELFPERARTAPQMLRGQRRTDEQVLEAGQRDPEFVRLYWHWDGQGNWSNLDLTLANKLRILTGGNLEQMDRLFRKSALYRDKWERSWQGSTYGRRTLEKALASDFGR